MPKDPPDTIPVNPDPKQGSGAMPIGKEPARRDPPEPLPNDGPGKVPAALPVGKSKKEA